MIRIRREDETPDGTGAEILDTLRSLLRNIIYK